jgi:hypothetical protein
MSSTKGLVLSLHASLADKGLIRGTNTAPTKEWYDLSGNGNHGSLNGFQYTTDSGWVGNNAGQDPYSLYLDGLNDYVDCGSSSNLKTTASVTFEAWAYYIGGFNVLSSGGQGDNKQGIAIRFNELGELYLHVTTPTKRAVFNFGTQPRSAWYHIVGSYDESTGLLYAYLNGAPQGRAVETTGTFTVAPTNLIIGKHNETATEWFRGAIPVVRIYNRALTSGEVATNYFDGYLLHSADKPLYSSIQVPERLDLTSQIRIGIGGRLAGSYGIIPSVNEDLSSSIEVTQIEDLHGLIRVTPVITMAGRYEIEPLYADDLSGSIEVANIGTIAGNMKIASTGLLFASYGMQGLERNDLQSTMSIRQVDSLPSKIAVYSHSKAFARYDFQGIEVNDLPSSIKVAGTVNLVGKVSVNSSSILHGKYGMLTSNIVELTSSIAVSSTSQIRGIVGVNAKTRLVAKYGLVVGGASSINSSITVTSVSNLKSSIKITTRSWMVAKYGIMAGGMTDLRSSISIPTIEDLDSSIMINLHDTLHGRYDITGLYAEDLVSSMTIREFSQLPSSIAISPYTSMQGKFNFVEPPSFRVTDTSIKDAFVRKTVPRLNYGVEEQMYIGGSSNADEIYRSFVEFDLKNMSIPATNATIAKAEMQLYFDGYNAPEKMIQIIEPDKSWTEYGVTWTNQPYPSVIDGLNIVQSVGGNSGYVSFDVTSAIQAWHDGSREHFGFLLKALDETENTSARFFTKEQRSFRPTLIVTYYDTQIYSLGQDGIMADITVQANRTKDLKCSIFLKSYKDDSPLAGSIFVDNPRDMFSYISVIRENLISHVTVRKNAYDDVRVSMVVMKRFYNDLLDNSITVNALERPSVIYVPYRSDIPTSVSVARWGAPPAEVESSILINREEIVGGVIVRQFASDDLTSTALIGSPDLEGSLIVLNTLNLYSNLKVKKWGEGNLPSEGYVRYYEDLQGSVEVSREWVNGNISVVYISQLPSSINVKSMEIDEIESTISISPRSDIHGSMDVSPYEVLPSSLFVLSGNISSSIVVPYTIRKDIKSYLVVRVRGASDLEGSYGVRSGWLGGHVNVKVWGDNDLPSSVSVKAKGDDDLESSIWIRGWGDNSLKGHIAARKSRESDLYSRISLRVNDESLLEGEITVKVWDKDSRPSTIIVRVWDKNDKPSHVAVRLTKDSDLTGSISVKEHSNLQGSITARVLSDTGGLEGYISVWEKSLLNGSISVWEKSILEGSIGVWRKSTIDCSITVKGSADKDLPSSINVWEKSLLEGHITLRHKSQIPCYIEVKQHSSLEGSIDVVAEYGYCFIM